MSEFRFRGIAVPEHTLRGLQDYVARGYPPGSFLRAVLIHDLFGAVANADEQNLFALPAIVAWVYNEAPSQCHGSAGAIDEWVAKHQEQEAEA